MVGKLTLGKLVVREAGVRKVNGWEVDVGKVSG